MRIKTAGPVVPAVEIEDADWALDSGRYIATLIIAGCLMHLEAFPIDTDDYGYQNFPAEWDAALSAIYGAVGADGGWDTAIVQGVECVLVATPF
jgi:hypothetical protein